MSTTTVTAELHRERRPHRWAPRLVSAEILKLRKRIGLVVSVLLLITAPPIIAYTVVAAENHDKGGMESFMQVFGMLGGMSVVAAMIVGATVGAGDLSAGVFRELVATGRSRFALFAARVPAGLSLLLPIVGLGFAISAAAATALAGSRETTITHGIVALGNVAPSASVLLQSAGWLALVTTVSFALALGVTSLIGSRGPSIGVLLGWWLVGMPLLMGLDGLGSLRQALVVPAMERLMPEGMLDQPAVPMPLAGAILVLLAWTAIPLGLGAWRTCTQDA